MWICSFSTEHDILVNPAHIGWAGNTHLAATCWWGWGHMPTRDKDSIGVRVELLFNAELINQITDIRRSLREGGAPISANGKGKKR